MDEVRVGIAFEQRREGACDEAADFGEDADNWADCFAFEGFNCSGILLVTMPFPNVRSDNFAICDDRACLIDSRQESCVYEHRIAGENCQGQRLRAFHFEGGPAWALPVYSLPRNMIQKVTQ